MVAKALFFTSQEEKDKFYQQQKIYNIRNTLYKAKTYGWNGNAINDVNSVIEKYCEENVNKFPNHSKESIENIIRDFIKKLDLE